MKIIATVTNVSDVIHCGGDVDRRSVIIDIGDNIPSLLKTYSANQKWAKEAPNRYAYESLSFSLLEDENGLP